MAEFGPSAQARAIASAGLRAGLAGSICLAVLVAGIFSFAMAGGTMDSLFTSLWIAVATFLMATVFGTIAVILCLLLFGWPLAGLARKHLAGTAGLAIAIAASVFVSVILAGILSNAQAIVLILVYAIPAAIYYRQEILIEKIFD